MVWELIEAKDRECTIDESGLYAIINRSVKTETHKEYSGTRILVRADLMDEQDEPIRSWQGTANNVRKHLIAYIAEHYGYAAISSEHASYIGYELMRAEMDSNYVQD